MKKMSILKKSGNIPVYWGKREAETNFNKADGRDIKGNEEASRGDTETGRGSEKSRGRDAETVAKAITQR